MAIEAMAARNMDGEGAAEQLVNAIVSAGVGDVEVEQVRGKPAPSLRPRNRADIRQAVLLASRSGARVAVTRRLAPGLIALDLSLLSEIDPPDERTCLIRVGAGAKVRDVEARAIQVGLSLGPLLPSSPRKTVGAWLAGPTRGERAIPPGRLETAALAIEAVLAEGGGYKSKETPRSATGPDLDHLLLGSEGRFGIITRATLRLMPRTLVEAAAARSATSYVDAIDAVTRAARGGLDPAEARWDRTRAIVESRFTGTAAAAHARRFGDAPVAGHEIKGHLELAGTWHAWSALTPLRPQAFQLVALTGDSAFGAIELETEADAEEAARYARAIGLTIVSPRKLRPSPETGWSSGASGLFEALSQAADGTGVFRREERPVTSPAPGAPARP